MVAACAERQQLQAQARDSRAFTHDVGARLESDSRLANSHTETGHDARYETADTAVRAVRKVAKPLRELTCHMASHGVTCHPAEVTYSMVSK